VAYLLDTSILARLANAADVYHTAAAGPVVELHRRGEVLHVTPQVLVEFRNVATRPAAQNGLGLSAVDAEAQAATFEAAFPPMETPGLWRRVWRMEVVRRFVDVALVKHYRMAPGPVPPEMLDPTVTPQDGWVGWKPVPSTVTDADLNSLEAEYRFRYPPLYRELLQTVHYFELTWIGFHFVPHVVGLWRQELVRLYRACAGDRILGRGLLPFGSESSLDAGPACFDTRYRRPDGDCPIVFWDHEWIGSDREISPLFSSSERMFRCLTFAAEAPIPFTYRASEDPPSLVAEKRALMAQFLALDPDGAGGPARAYWTAGGLDPHAS
jgi:hypothetical protein